MSKYSCILSTLLVFGACIAGEDEPDIRVEEILALDSDVDYGEYLASECSTCHNDSSGDNGIPIIRGKEEAYLILALLEYQDDKRINETMRSVAGALQNEEIGALALYFSGL